MKLYIVFLLFPILVHGQSNINFESSTEFPYGRLNPEAPKEVADYAPMIGTCDCISTKRNADQTWGESQKMTWTFKYILNGTAVQDESFKEDGSHSGSIRQFVADSSRWYVHWYSNKTPSTKLPSWEGNKRGDSIVLYKEQKAPNGSDGFLRLTFKNITPKSFNWVGEWVNTSETIVFPTWKIDCIKQNPASDKERILQNITAFSVAYMRGDAKAIAEFYSEDGKIFPANSDIISGREAIEKRWVMPEGVKGIYHKVTPSEITIIENYAYDYGYYEGKTLSKEKEELSFKGKYVIVWKKTDDEWKIYLDIWNRL